MSEPSRDHSVLRLGAVVSIAQSALFVVIGGAALALGADRLVDDGFAALAASNLGAVRVLCTAFVLIAVLGLAITPAERAAIESSNRGLAAFGANLAYLGHAGTIAYFSWWLLATRHGTSPDAASDALAPIEWGVMFELVFVGGWVWIIAATIRNDAHWPHWFFLLSALKASVFWFAFAAFLLGSVSMITLGVGAVTFLAGPSWHLAIARILDRRAEDEST
jgi:hypothetical protein